MPLLPGFFFRTLTGPQKRQKQQNLALRARSRPHFHRSERTGQIFCAQKRCLTKSSWIHHRSSKFHWYPSLVKSSRQIWTVWTSSFLIWRVLVLVKAYAFEIFSRPPSGLREIFFLGSETGSFPHDTGRETDWGSSGVLSTSTPSEAITKLYQRT